MAIAFNNSTYLRNEKKYFSDKLKKTQKSCNTGESSFYFVKKSESTFNHLYHMLLLQMEEFFCDVNDLRNLEAPEPKDFIYSCPLVT